VLASAEVLSSDVVASADVVVDVADVDVSEDESSDLLQPAAVAPMTRAATARLVADIRAISMDFLSEGWPPAGPADIDLQHRQ
jgi:hypothetical protein